MQRTIDVRYMHWSPPLPPLLHKRYTQLYFFILEWMHGVRRGRSILWCAKLTPLGTKVTPNRLQVDDLYPKRLNLAKNNRLLISSRFLTWCSYFQRSNLFPKCPQFVSRDHCFPFLFPSYYVDCSNQWNYESCRIVDHINYQSKVID